jgi:tetratricopeptide (TPR) repeat protein
VLTPDRERPRAPRTRRASETDEAQARGTPNAEAVLGLQAAVGNAAVARLLAREPTDGDDEPPVTKTGFDGAQEWGDRAFRYWNEKQWEKSRHAWAEAYKLSPVPTFLYNEAACLEEMGKIPEAIAMYKAYLADNPAETDVEKTREHVKRLEGGGGADAPAHQVDKPGEGSGGGNPAGPGGDPDDAPVTKTGWDGAQEWGDRAYRYYEAKEWEKSRHAWEEAYKLVNVPTFLYNEAACLEQMGRFPEAIAMYEAYLGDNPAETDVEKTREHVRKLKETHGGAAPPAPGGVEAPAQVPAGQQQPTAEEPITEVGEKGAEKWFDRGMAAYQAKEFEKAYEGFMHAYHLLPRAEFLYNAGAARELGGDVDAGIALYDRYLAEKPDAADAAKVKAHIEKIKGKPMPETEAEKDEGPPITETGTEGAQKWFDRATAAYLAKEYGKAYSAFMHSYHLLPQAETLYNAAAALDLGGDLDAAIAMYDRYLAEKPAASDAARVKKRIEKLRAGADGGQVEETGGGSAGPGGGAETPITATGKEGSRQWFDRGQEQFQQGRFEEAAESFAKAFDLDPVPDFVFDQGAALEKAGREGAAAKAFQHYLSIKPDAKDYKETVERVKKLREKAKSDPIADPWEEEAAGAEPTGTGTKGAEQWFDRGMAAYQVGEYKGAHTDFMKAYELKPLPQFLYNAGAALQKDGDIQGAIDLYERYLAEDPAATDAAKVKKAIETLKAKLAGDEAGKGHAPPGEEGAEGAEPPITAAGPDGAKQWYARGEKQVKAARYQEAADSFEQAFNLDPQAAYMFDWGVALQAAGRDAAAIVAFERVLVLKPDTKKREEIIERVKMLRGRVKDDKIVDPWEDEAAGPDPSGEGKEGAKQWYAKAAAAYDTGDYKAAHDGFLKAYDLAPQAAYLFDAAIAAELGGDTEEAIKLYERTLADPNLKDASRPQERLDNLKQQKEPAGAAAP